MSAPLLSHSDSVTVGAHSLQVWPKGQKVQNWYKSGILVTRFPDHEVYADALSATALERAKDPELAHQFSQRVGVGGAKAYDIGQWPTAEARLINARAMALFGLAAGGAPAVVDASWATIYHDGNFFMPHSHARTLFSVLYVLELGVVADGNNGRFFFADPRLAACCQQEKGYMTSPCAPEFIPGTMLLFPGQVVHFVTPFYGDEPRITMSWDLNKVAVEGSALPEWVGRPG